MKAKIVWVLISLWLLLLVSWVIVSKSSAEKILLQWDIAENVDGYMIFQYQKNETYDYNNPVKTVVYPEGKIPADIDRIIIDVPGIAGQDVKYRWVARSFRGDEQSVDSNEVTYVVASTIPPAPSEIIGQYEKDKSIITISWVQPEESEEWQTISHWIIYWRFKGDEEWVPIGRINADHALSMEAPFAAVEPEQQSEVEFTIVAYRRSGVYSQNSDILTLDIDRRGVPPVQNLRINIEIPVT